MRRLAVACCLLLSAPAAAQAESTIADGVTAGGVDLSGLTVDQGAKRLQARLGAHVRRAVVLRVGGRTFRMTSARSRVSLDAVRTAKRALYARDDLPAQPDDPAGGAVSGLEVPLALTHSPAAVAAFTEQARRRVSRRARNARVYFGIRRQRVRRARHGRTFDAKSLARNMSLALEDPALPRRFARRLRSVSPAVSVADLRRANPTMLTVDRATFTLRLFKRLRLSKTYGVAVGMAGLDTPAGRYRIQSRQVDPAWHVPDRDWAGSLRGKVIPGGAPNNPLKARWLGIANGVGIHGTGEEWTIGSRASHGCIRMRVADVKDLYPRVPVGTRVIIR